MDTLSARDQALLAFEQEHPRHNGRKEELIRIRFGLSAARYYQQLNALSARPEAVAAHPMVVGRFMRQARQRADARAMRRFGS